MFDGNALAIYLIHRNEQARFFFVCLFFGVLLLFFLSKVWFWEMRPFGFVKWLLTVAESEFR